MRINFPRPVHPFTRLSSSLVTVTHRFHEGHIVHGVDQLVELVFKIFTVSHLVLVVVIEIIEVDGLVAIIGDEVTLVRSILETGQQVVEDVKVLFAFVLKDDSRFLEQIFGYFPANN